MRSTSFAIFIQPPFPSRCRLNSLKCLLLGLICLFFSKTAGAQCTNYVQLTLDYGPLDIGCTTVNLSHAGASYLEPFYCGIGPYRIGNYSTSGSYTFTFYPPVQEIKVDVVALDNHHIGSFAHYEELLFNINGVFTPLSNPGTGAPLCESPAIVSSSGGLIAAPGYNGVDGYGETRDLIFSQTISSFKMTDSIFSGLANGVDVSVFVCCNCNTDAGNITSGPLSVCVPSQISLPNATQTFLYSDDLLKYILFSNPANPTGSIVATNNTPVFSFNPATMQADQTYYVAAIAGHGISGNIDLTDPCLDLSNVIEVLWHGRPAVTFSVSNPNVCGGACATVNVHFTGTPPFILSYTNPLTGSVTQTFSESAGTFSICPPVNAPGGALVVSATSLVDAVCSCQ
ncbi:MAG: hypothetical protein WCR52_12680 [Bacteroidota bacterium]